MNNKFKQLKKNFLKIIPFLGVIFLVSCASPKKIVYFQDVEGLNLKDSIRNFESKIQAGDLLFINVSATDAEAAIPFNLYETPVLGNRISSAIPINYLVNANGVINFPTIGTVEVAGFTTNELTHKFHEILTDYITNPILNIRIANFKVSVLGEVNSPGSIGVLNERISIIEAIGLAGDLTIYGKRKSILLIREVEGKKEFITLDLTNKKMFDSPYYYLKQNDVIYVAPNNTKVNASAVGPNTGVILSSVSVLIALLALLL